MSVNYYYPLPEITIERTDDYTRVRLGPNNKCSGSMIATLTLVGLDPDQYANPDALLGEITLSFEGSKGGKITFDHKDTIELRGLLMSFVDTIDRELLRCDPPSEAME